MTKSVENFSIVELEQMKISMQGAYQQHIKDGETDKAEKLNVLILKADLAIKKKTEQNAAEEKLLAPKSEIVKQFKAAHAAGGSIDTDVVAVGDNIVISNTQNNEELEEHYKFVTKSAFIYFDTLKRQLNQYLRNWVIKKSKEPHHKIEMENKVADVLEEIHAAINIYSVEKHSDLLRNTTYSIGIPNDKRRYSFHINQLKKDFEF